MGGKALTGETAERRQSRQQPNHLPIEAFDTTAEEPFAEMSISFDLIEKN